jgi:2-aminoadipate transaminase
VAALSDRVIRLSSASKILAPALRVGWLHGDRRVCEAVELLKQGADLCGSSLTHQIAAGLLSDEPWLDLYLDMLRDRYGSRARALADGVSSTFGDRARVSSAVGGMFCWTEFADPGPDTAALLQTAVEHGVAFVPGSAFGVAAGHRSALRLCFATCSEDTLTDAAARLGAAYADHAQS